MSRPTRLERSPGASAVVRASGPAPRRAPNAAEGPLEAVISALQRAVGNRAVAHLLEGAGSRGVSVQRAKLNIRPPSAARAGTISGVSGFPDRPSSNLRSGQGQHLTAYVVFEQMIKSRVRDRTPQEAAESLIAVAGEIKALPPMNPPSQFNNHIHVGLDEVIAEMSRLKGRDLTTIAEGVGAQIDKILVLRNQIPGTAISIPGTRGHGEARSSGSLETIETGLREGGHAWGDREAAQAVETMWYLFDYDPPPPGDAVIREAIAKRVLTHLLSMRMAFPATWLWLTGMDERFHLMPYLIANAGKAGLPLPRLDKAQLRAIKDYVYARF